MWKVIGSMLGRRYVQQAGRMVAFCMLTPYLLYSYVFAQNFSPVQYKVDDGLPSNTIYRIVQDKEGYIWIATQNGLCRFDGEKFVLYGHPDMKDQDIIHLDASQDTALLTFTNVSGQLGFATKDSLHFFKPEGQSHVRVSDIRFGAKGKFWAWSYNYPHDASHLLGFRLKDKKLFFKEQEYNSLTEVYWDDASQKLYTIGNRLSEYDSTGQKLSSFPLFSSEVVDSFHTTLIGHGLYPKSPNGWFFIAQVRKVQSGSRLQLVFVANDQLQAIRWQNAPNKLEVFCMIQDHKGRHLLGTNHGLYEFEYTEEGLGWLKANYFPYQTVHTLFQDREQNIWIGTKNEGVFLFSGASFPIYPPDSLDYRVEGPRKLASVGGSLYGVSERGSLFRVNSQGKLSVDNIPELLSFTHCYPAPQGQLVLSSDFQLFQLDPDDQSIIRISNFSFDGIDKSPTCIKDLHYQDSLMYLASCGGLLVLHPLKRKAQMLDKLRSVSILWDSMRSVFWYGTVYGIKQYHPQRGSKRVLDQEGKNIPTMVYCMAQAADGSVYFGTHGKGLWRYKDGLFSQVNSLFDIEANSFSDLLIHRNWLWTCSDKGLIKINLNNGEAATIRGPGLQGELFNMARVEEDIWLSTSNGVVKVPLQSEKPPLTPPKVFLESFVAQNNKGERKSGLSFSHTYNRITVAFSSPLYSQKANYFYKLNDGTWEKIDNSPLLLSALEPGDYELSIANKLGEDWEKEDQLLRINFQISPPLWSRIEFMLALLIFLGTLLFYLIRGFYRRRFKRFRERERMQREIERMRLKALQAQMNPHFIFNALNAIQELILQNDTLPAVNYLADFARLIRKTLEMVDKPLISLAEEIDFLQTYIRLELIRHQTPIQVDWYIDPRINKTKVFLPPMLIQPLIENVFKHAFFPELENPHMCISFKRENQDLVLELEDNGQGIHQSLENKRTSREYESKGTQLVLDRLVNLPGEPRKGDLTYEDLKKKGRSGTKAILRIQAEGEEPHAPLG